MQQETWLTKVFQIDTASTAEYPCWTFLRSATDLLKQVFDGKLILQEMKLETRHSFLDYITTGLEISLIVAIDFTRSNKDVNKKESMHHYDVSTANEYVLAIRAVGEILQHYDSDDRSPGCSTVPS